jgi:hypothetical protein
MRKPIVLLAVALTIAGCAMTNEPSTPSELATPSQSVAPSLGPTASLPEACGSEPVDVAAMIAFTQANVVTPPVACFGDAPLTFEANWVGGGIADCPAAPEPAWLACSSFNLQAVGDTRKVGAAQLFVAVDPALTTLPDPGTDVQVTAQFDHPAAQDCHETGSMPGESPAAVTEMIERCRNTLVITDVTP